MFRGSFPALSVSPVHAKMLGCETLLHFSPTILIFFLAKIRYDFEESLTPEIIYIYCRQCKFESQIMIVSPNSNQLLIICRSNTSIVSVIFGQFFHWLQIFIVIKLITVRYIFSKIMKSEE